MPDRPGVYRKKPGRPPTSWMGLYMDVPESPQLCVSDSTVRACQRKNIPRSDMQLEQWRRLGVVVNELAKDANIPMIPANPASMVGVFVFQSAQETEDDVTDAERDAEGDVAMEDSQPASTTTTAPQVPKERFGRADWVIGQMSRAAFVPNPEPDEAQPQPAKRTTRSAKAAKRAQDRAAKAVSDAKASDMWATFSPFGVAELKASGFLDGDDARKTCARGYADPPETLTTEGARTRSGRKAPQARPYHMRYGLSRKGSFQETIFRKPLKDKFRQLGAYLVMGKMRHGLLFDDVFAILAKYTDLTFEQRAQPMDRDDFLNTVIGFYFEGFVEKVDEAQRLTPEDLEMLVEEFDQEHPGRLD
ncbi:hypothetical protein F5X68DRAFT_188364 [Plectosphaerella plurivora]|uniref:Uncharacterized protein n=1 Tax=Plectosphaerella plurivora TaxID=936078 RepID=A0A9P9ADP3_9PEZI|nr:hypothetical protein F5X68DRAFT_188364 [Plectosphaerella plurivora]